nr:MAG TPA: hypothetical protein [Caudoviricetes sp.]
MCGRLQVVNTSFSCSLFVCALKYTSFVFCSCLFICER